MVSANDASSNWPLDVSPSYGTVRHTKTEKSSGWDCALVWAHLPFHFCPEAHAVIHTLNFW